MCDPTPKKTSIEAIKKSYNGLKKDFQDYTLFFGPVKEIFLAPYFHLAVLLAVITSFFGEKPENWTVFALSGLPSLLGFSIGGYAIIITFGDSEFREFLILNKPENKPLLMVINGIFIHFILFQTLALMLALVVNLLGVQSAFANAIISIPFFYSILLSTSIAFSIKTVSQWYVKFIESKKKLEKEIVEFKNNE